MKNADSKLKAVCVFCSSGSEVSAEIKEDGRKLGALMAKRGYELVYGGTDCGLMKIVAESHQKAGGRVVGIVPKFMVEEGIHNSTQDETVIVENMRDRKAVMQERAEAFIALPGGLGTYDELFDTIALKQLGMHDKPILLINTEGYYDLFLSMLKHGIAEKTIKKEYLAYIKIVGSPEEAVAFLSAYY